MKKIVNGIVLALVLWVLPTAANAQTMLIPVGRVVGLELANNTVTVAAFDENLGQPAKAAGLQVGDRIVDIDGRQICCAEDVRASLIQSDGSVDMLVMRQGKEHTLHIQPRITQEGPKLGVYLRNGITGIGTVTFYNPDTGRFGTLGHGVNDESGRLLHLTIGKAYPANVVSVRRGKSGEPGQLMGVLSSNKPIGPLTKNTNQGVFGTAHQNFQGQAIPVGTVDDIQTGQATIRSTISGNQPQEYSVEILKIYPNARSNGRNMLIRVTDEKLLETTGGIVQGMSGSPIIQDGKLVGAVTHVLVNDPTTGYGIFIENMLDAAA